MRIQSTYSYYSLNRNNEIKKTSFQKKVFPKNVKKVLDYGIIGLAIPIGYVTLNRISNSDSNPKIHTNQTVYKQVAPAQKFFNSKEAVLEYSKERIAEYLNAEKPVEYGVVIEIKKNNKYEVLTENIGDSTSVRNTNLTLILCNELGINKPYIKLHGHPKDNTPPGHVGTQTFSFQDFKNFNNDFNCKETYTVNHLMQHCVFSKKEGFKPLNKTELEKVEKEYSENFHYCWSNPVEVIKDGKVIHEFRDYQGMHKFWDKIAKKYNLEYKTTYGTFNGIDAYNKSYYPELENLDT